MQGSKHVYTTQTLLSLNTLMLWFRAQLEFVLECYAPDRRIIGALKDVCNVDARLHFSYRSRELYQELQESSGLIDSVSR